MADCGTIEITCPTINCEDDLQAAWTDLCIEVQAAIDALKACIESYELPDCDITVMKDDFVNDPLACNMVDFTGITYGTEGDVCQLPYPSGGYTWREGSARTTHPMDEAYGWQSVAVTFDTPFPSNCLGVDITITACHPVPTVTGPEPYVSRFYAPIVQESLISANGFTVWFKSDEVGEFDYVTFRYKAMGN